VPWLRGATCTFSVRAFGKLDETLELAGKGRITIKIRLQSDIF
jgi:hypothetical protein